MTFAGQPVSATEVPGFLKQHIKEILMQYACYMSEVIDHQKPQGISSAAAESLFGLRQKTTHFIDMICDTIASSTEAGELLHRSLEEITSKIDLYKTMKAAFSGALSPSQGPAIDYMSSCILPPSIQLPLNLLIINQLGIDALNYASLRPGALVCVSRGPTPGWMLDKVCTEYIQNKTTEFTLSSKPLEHRLCVVTRIWFENSILPEDARAFLMSVPARRQKNLFLLEPGADTLGTIREEDILSMYGSDLITSEPASKLDALFEKQYSNSYPAVRDIESLVSSDIYEKIIKQAKDIPQKVVRNDKYTRTQMDRALLRLMTRFRIELLDIHESEIHQEITTNSTNPISSEAPRAPLDFLTDIAGGIHSSMPWLSTPLRLSYGTRYVVDARTVTLADLGIMLDPFIDQMVFCPASNTYCLAYNKLQKKLRVAFVHDGPTRENRFHARISWVKARKQLSKTSDERSITMQADSLDSVHLFDADAWLANNTVYDCICCNSQGQAERSGRVKNKSGRGEAKQFKAASNHLTALIFARFLAPLPSSTRFLEIMYDDIFPTMALLRKPKRKFYANAMRMCIEFTE